MLRSFQRTAAIAMGSILISGALVSCGDTVDETETVATTSTASTSSGHAAHSDDVVTLENGTVRAKADADTEHGNDMTAIFGTLRNHTDHEVTISGFSTSLEGGTNQIHEVKDGVMQEKVGGITIPADGSHEMAPGGDHLMVMDYAQPIHAGDTLNLTLELADGSTVEIPDLAVRTMAAGEEDYGDHGAHNH